jgi:hypothetical protein
LPEEEAIVKDINSSNTKAIDVGSTLLRAMVTNYAQRLQSTNPDVSKTDTLNCFIKSAVEVIVLS